MFLTDFDATRDAIINPYHKHLTISDDAVPDTAICVYDGQIIAQLLAQDLLTYIGYQKSINRKESLYVYTLPNKKQVLVMLILMGAPASVGVLEEISSMGVQHYIVLGTCGVLTARHDADHVILPARALRDEGTSFHYATAGDFIDAQSSSLALMACVLDEAQVGFSVATTWSTDAFYRETRAKMARCLELGVEVVDMEAAALMAWSQWRHVNLYQFFYTADQLTTAGWNQRKETRLRNVNEFFQLAEMMAVRITGD